MNKSKSTVNCVLMLRQSNGRFRCWARKEQMNESDTKSGFPKSMPSVAGLQSWQSKSLSVMALLLLTGFLGACGTFADVAGAQRPIARLEVYKPPRPAPVIPVMINLAMPQVWEAHDAELPLLCLPIEHGFDLKAWVASVVRNQSEWAAYADFMEKK